MNNLSKLGKIVETDALIIGGGSSGLWAANKIKSLDSNLDVLVVDKGARDWGGLMSMSGGDFDVVFPGESVDDWVQEFVYYWDGLCEQDLMEKLLTHSYERFKDYERLGCEFLKKPDGSYKGVPQRGLKHVKMYPSKLKGTGGKDMAQVVIKEAERLGVKRMGRTLVTELIKNGNKVVGVVGFNYRSGEFYIFKAKAVLITTGVGGWKSSYMQNSATGEGMGMVFKAGVKLKNFEFARVWNVPRLYSYEGQTALFPLGARFINAEGEPFMDRYSPVLGNNTDPHYMTLAMAYEARAGRAPFYLDISQVKAEDLELVKPQTGWQVINYDKLVELGIDYMKENTEWMPQLQRSFGGVDTDIEGRTSVEGLFAAGCARPLVPGCYNGGFALFTTSVMGSMVGETVADYIGSSETSSFPLEADEVKEIKKQLYHPLGKPGIPPKEILRAIQEVVYPIDVCKLKSEKSLQNALSKLEEIKEDLLPQMTAPDAHYLLKLREVQGIAFVTELYLRASLFRKESRAGHYREDYPKRDDQNWLKWVMISKKDGEIHLDTEPVPFHKYKFQPPVPSYMDNFRFE